MSRPKNSNMTKTKQGNSDKGKKSATSRKHGYSTSKNTTDVLEDKLALARRNERVANKNVKTELEDAALNETSLRASNKEACPRCKELEIEIERLQNELNKLKDKEKSGFPLSIAELIMEKVTALESTVSAMRAAKISALCAMEMTMKDANYDINLEVKDDKGKIASWQVMNRTDKKAEWYNALLHGTFGEDAMNYRVNPRSKENKSFDPVFLNVAEGHFCIFLDRRISELKGKEDDFSRHLLDFFQSNRGKLIKQLPANLSDRAYALYRGKYKGKKKLPGEKVAKSAQKAPKSHGKPLCKMLTQLRPKKGLELLCQMNTSSDESEEEELEQ